MLGDCDPVVASIRRRVHLTASRSEVDAALVEGVDSHCVAENVDVAVVLGQAVREEFPIVAAGAAARDAELPVRWVVLGVALDRDDVDGLGLVGVDADRESEVAGEIAADLRPVSARVVTAADVPMLLHKQRVRAGRMHREVVDAVTDLSLRVGEEAGTQAPGGNLPRRSLIVRAKRSRGGDRDVHAPRVCRVDDDRVQAHATGPRSPLGGAGVSSKAGEFPPCLASVV